MASIAGSQFDATAGIQPVNVVLTPDGTLPPPVPGQFNLEVYTGGPPVPGLAPGYQGLVVLSNGGNDITLVTGAFEIEDTGTGTHSITALGDNETISAGPGNNDVLTAYGLNDVIIGGGQDTITVYGTGDTVQGVGNDLITVWGPSNYIDLGTGADTTSLFSSGNTVTGGGASNQILSDFAGNNTIGTGTGNDLINAFGSGETINGGSAGNDTINVFGAGSQVTDGSGNDRIALFGANSSVNAGAGNDSVSVFGNVETVLGGADNDTIALFGSNSTVFGGSGLDQILAIGNFDTVQAGSGNTSITMIGNNNVFGGGSGGADTLIGYGDNNILIGATSPGSLFTSYGNNDYIALSSGNDAATIGGNGDSVIAGSLAGTNQDTVTFQYGTNHLFIDGSNVYADTVIGFNQAVGDRILLTGGESVANAVATSTQVNAGADTLITLSDTSTILLKGVTSIDSSFFS